MPIKQKKWWRARVIRGKGLGKELGYPTANLELPNNWQLDYGIYAADVSVAGEGYGGVLYWGTRGGTGESLEVHLFDFDDDLYSRVLSFRVGQFIREDRSIGSDEELKTQIAQDIKMAKQY